MKRLPALILLLLMSTSAWGQIATIEGAVQDAKTGQSIPGVTVDIYSSEDHSSPLHTLTTDEKGYYSVNVQTGRFYDVYLRVGETNPNQRTPEPVKQNGVYTINFQISTESSYADSVVEKYGFGIVLLAAGLLFLVILIDQAASMRKNKGPTSKDLLREKQALQEMIELTRQKYHRREIDDESYREITRDQQKKLIELESRIKDSG